MCEKKDRVVITGVSYVTYGAFYKQNLCNVWRSPLYREHVDVRPYTESLLAYSFAFLRATRALIHEGIRIVDQNYIAIGNVLLERISKI